jgi:hypothetical protein
MNWEGRTNFYMSSPFSGSAAGDYSYIYISSSTPYENGPWQWNEGWELLLVITYKNKQHDKNLSRNCRK